MPSYIIISWKKCVLECSSSSTSEYLDFKICEGESLERVEGSGESREGLVNEYSVAVSDVNYNHNSAGILAVIDVSDSACLNELPVNLPK